MSNLLGLWIFKGGFVVKIENWYQCLLLGRIVLIEIESLWFCDLTIHEENSVSRESKFGMILSIN
jgi:hypothetical protein